MIAPPAIKLKFDTLPICGRAKEIATLSQAADRVDKQENPEVIFITGDSGSGKTTLWKQLQQLSASRFFITGKFDESNKSCAVRDAMAELCDQIADSEDLHIIREELSDSLGPEDAILRCAIPQVERILGSTMELVERSYNETVAFNRMKHSFRALLRSAVVTGKTVIMCIDDIHWADQESWDLIRDIALDQTLPHLLLIGAYRAIETCPVTGEHLALLSQQSRFRSISLHDFSVSQVNELVATLLRMSKAKTESLATIVHAKSAGNPHFAVQILKAIEKQKLIKHSMSKFCWEWDIETIQSDTDIGDNIVDTYLLKISTLPVDTRFSLIIGSCLGAKFDALVVESLLVTIRPPKTREIMGRDRLMNALEVASQEGVVDRQRGSSVYRFAHDKIHQAFYTLVTEIASADKVHLKIGRALMSVWKQMAPKEDWLSFLAATQLNRCLHLLEDVDEMTAIAKLNLASAKAAMSSSAFRPTANYLSHGLQVMEGIGWSQYEVRLELLTYKARTDLCLGHFTECYSAIGEVLQNARTTKDKIPVFQVCVDAYGAEGKVTTSVQEGLTFVKELGVKLPRKFNKLTVIMALIKAKKAMKGKTEEDLLNFPLANDPSKIAAVRIINTIVTYAFQARMSDIMATLALVNTRLILIYGFTDEAGSILVCYAFLLAWIGDFDVGYKIGQICLKLAEKSKSGIPRTFMNYYGGLDHLKKPLHQSLEPLLRGYKSGFEVGDTVYGFYCCHFYLSIFYFVGLPLKNLLRDMESFGNEMKAYNMQITLDLLNVYHQSVINLMSTTVEHPVTLDGTAMTEASVWRCGVQQTVESLWFGKLIMAIYFNDSHVIRENLDKLVYDRAPDLDGCMHYVPMLMWCEGCGAILVARATKRRKYHKLALKRFKTIESWVKGGNVNCYHYLQHLTAELAVLNKKPVGRVKELYDIAISASRRGGFSNMAAVANERAALYFLEHHDHDRASMYMTSAFELYETWGARRKCLALIREHARLLSSEQASNELTPASGAESRGTSFAGRKRHTSLVGRLHRGETLELMAYSANSLGQNSDSSFRLFVEGSSLSMTPSEGLNPQEADPFK
ncbi:PhoQ sensor [Fragilaria crotonensis]|nr:PhoQ sensor [Fragilaria crotonensis]